MYVCEREIVHKYVCVLMCVCIYTQVRRTQGKAAKAEQAIHRYLHTHYTILFQRKRALKLEGCIASGA